MKKVLLVILLSFIIALPLFSIGFGYHVLDIKTSGDFSIGGHFELPVSVLYQFNFPVPDLIGGSATSLAFRLDNGLDYRTLKQDPDSGRLLEDDDPRFPKREYMSLFDEFNLEFAQGLLNLPFTGEDFITVKASIDGRFENAYERTSFFSNSDNREGVFHTLNEDQSKIIDRYPFGSSPLSGTPELAGSRSTFMISLTAGLDINLMQDDITRMNGLKLSSLFRWSPSALQFFSADVDFYYWESDLDFAWTLFSFDNISSLVIKNETEYIYVSGEKVPYYALDNQIWGAYALPTEHVITNKASLTLFGPELGARDLYPYVSGFFDVAFSFGKVLNSDQTIERDIVMSYGFKAELVIFSVSNIYYEIGWVADSINFDEASMIQKFGFRVGL